MTDTNNIDAGPPPPDPPAHRTHTSPAVIKLLKSLPLPAILKKNKQIEAENEARSIKTLNHIEDPVAYPDVGSEAASLITIDAANLARLRVPSFFISVRDHIYNSLATYLADLELLEKEEKKRKTDDKVNLSEDELRMSKRRCMDGSNLVERIVGEPLPIEFAQTLYDTEKCVAVPLPFFLSKNLRTLIDEGATLPTIKSNPLPGEVKGIYILDVDKLSARFGKELSLTCSQWTEAAGNMWDFQVSRDKLGIEGGHSIWFEKHFNFFNRLGERDEQYDAWKVMELEFRQNHRSRKLRFKGEDYDKAYDLVCESHKLRKEFHELFASSQGVAQGPRFPPASRGNPFNKSFQRTPSRFQPPSPSFPSGSGKSSSPNACCLICAEKGHNIFFHLKSTIEAKFVDGKPAWAKCSVSFGLVTPDNRAICINWNVRGAEAASQCATLHSKEERAHVCSFCGSKSHHALSWTCRNRST